MNEYDLSAIRRNVDDCIKSVDDLMKGGRSPGKMNEMLDEITRKIELACMDVRRICEQTRPKIPEIRAGRVNYHSKTIYGEITLTDAGWVHIKLNTLLPHYKILGGTQYISDSIIRIMDKFERSGGKLPRFDKAFLAIIEHCDYRSCEAFDNDNKGYKAVQNALKGRLFPDDDQFELSLGLFTIQDADASCHIYVLPEEDTTDFFCRKQSDSL